MTYYRQAHRIPFNSVPVKQISLSYYKRRKPIKTIIRKIAAPFCPGLTVCEEQAKHYEKMAREFWSDYEGASGRLKALEDEIKALDKISETQAAETISAMNDDSYWGNTAAKATKKAYDGEKVTLRNFNTSIDQATHPCTIGVAAAIDEKITVVTSLRNAAKAMAVFCQFWAEWLKTVSLSESLSGKLKKIYDGLHDEMTRYSLDPAMWLMIRSSFPDQLYNNSRSYRFYVDMERKEIGSRYIRFMYCDLGQVSSLDDINQELVSYAFSKLYAEHPMVPPCNAKCRPKSM